MTEEVKVNDSVAPPEVPAAFQEAKEYLRGVPGSGVSVYDHLTQVLVKLLDERPPDANALFEEVSSSVRDMTITEAPKPPTEQQLAEKCDVGSEHARLQVLSWTRDRTPMLVTPSAGELPVATVSFPDVLDESRMWSWGGVGFGDETTYLLHLGLKALATEKSLSVRFWGKIATRGGDYFVAESKTKANPAVGRLARLVLEGTEGPNKYTYWVTKAPGPANSWQALPHVTTAQLEVAQKVRRFFTGDLTSPVRCFPALPATPNTVTSDDETMAKAAEDAVSAAAAAAGGGKVAGTQGSEPMGTEANLLRAQIALITADTVLAPAGFFDNESEELPSGPSGGAGGEEGGGGGEVSVIKPSEAPEAVAFDALKETSTYCHAELDINAVGRTQPTVYPLGPDGEPLEPEEPDPEPLGALRSIAEDTRPCTEAEAALLSEAGLDTKTLWQLKGGEGVAVVPSGPATEEGSTTGKAESNQSVGVCKSLKWPGAVFVAREGKAYTNVYVGYGVVSSAVRPTGRPYEFPLPSEVQKEWVDANAEEDADPTAGMVEAKDVIFEPQAEAEEE